MQARTLSSAMVVEVKHVCHRLKVSSAGSVVEHDFGSRGLQEVSGLQFPMLLAEYLGGMMDLTGAVKMPGLVVAW